MWQQEQCSSQWEQNTRPTIYMRFLYRVFILLLMQQKSPSATLYEGNSENKEHLHIQSTHLFCCRRQLVSGVECDDEKLPHAVVRWTFSRGKCRHSCGYYSVQSGPATVATFSCFQKWRNTLLVNTLQMMKTWRMLSWLGWITRRQHVMKRVYTNWYHGTSDSCQRRICGNVGKGMHKLTYSLSVLSLENILVRQKVLYFMDDLLICLIEQR